MEITTAAAVTDLLTVCGENEALLLAFRAISLTTHRAPPSKHSGYSHWRDIEVIACGTGWKAAREGNCERNYCQKGTNWSGKGPAAEKGGGGGKQNRRIVRAGSRAKLRCDGDGCG